MSGFFKEVDLSNIKGPRLIVPERCGIAACVGQKSKSYALGEVLVVPGEDGRAFLCATDGKQMTIVDAEQNELNPYRFLLPVQALGKSQSIGVDFEKKEWRRIEGEQVHAGKLSEGVFPNVAEALPDLEDYSLQVLLATNLLSRVEKALWRTDEYGDKCSSDVFFADSSSPAVVDSDNGFGIVLPQYFESAPFGSVREKMKRFVAAYEASEELK